MVPVALVATRYLEPMLFGVPSTDPPTYWAAAILVVMAGVSGCSSPGKWSCGEKVTPLPIDEESEPSGPRPT